MKYTTIRIEGAILSPDILDKIESGDLGGQAPKDFGLDQRGKVKDEIALAWADAQELWRVFTSRMERVKDGETGATETRRYWVIPFLGMLGYNIELAKSYEIQGKTYAISHRDAGHNDFPVHIIGFREDLNEKPRRGGMSPHAMVQEFLNLHEHLYAMVTNGLVLRLLRDSSRLVKLSYIEFDLDRMFNEDHFADFAIMFRLIHQSRMPARIEDAPTSLIEKYHQDALDSGSRIREGLSGAVKRSIELLAEGFINHPANESLRADIKSQRLKSDEYYRHLLRLIYRVLLLMVIEERGLVYPRGADKKQRDIYYRFYSVQRLRNLCEKRFLVDGRHDDLWTGLCLTFRLFEEERFGGPLGITPLAGDLFHFRAMGTLNECRLENGILLDCLRNLSIFTNTSTGQTTRVNYASLSVEEFGSVYEGMLDYHLGIVEQRGKYSVSLVSGMERKTTGSYYTPQELVEELIKSALIPVMEDRLTNALGGDREKAILSMKVCDPACGSGHFLLAASRHLARNLARIRSKDEEPSPEAMRQASRDVISHCIYGVDKNPLAVELCKVALWIEGHAAGKPLTFLDHRIKCGDSLVGVMKYEDIVNGIPDGAFNPVTGDDKKLASELKKHNRKFAGENHGSLFADEKAEPPDLSEDLKSIDAMPDDSIGALEKKSAAYEKLHAKGSPWYNAFTACNLWTSAFFATITRENLDNKKVVTNEVFLRYLNGQDIDHRYSSHADAMAIDNRFFNWGIEFPEVFDQGGFDCVCGNPPWERIKLQEKEYFAIRNPEIAIATNKAEREKLIEYLKKSNPALSAEFELAKHNAEGQSKFIRESLRFPLTAVGDINTYAVFAEASRIILTPLGRMGIIVPTGIVTDDTTKSFFSDIVKNEGLVSVIGFENEEKIFADVHNQFKFCAFTVTGNGNKIQKSDLIFICRRFSDINNSLKHFSLSSSDIKLINPNTMTCPVFRTKYDAELTKKVYTRIPILENEKQSDGLWNISFMRMFDMSNDSSVFRETRESNMYSLVEAKMFYQYDHRYATYEGATQANINKGTLPQVEDALKTNPNYLTSPFYWVPIEKVNDRIHEKWKNKWFICFRRVTNIISERTTIFSINPFAGFGDSVFIIFINRAIIDILCIFANFNSIILDYFTRQKMGGSNLNYFILKQLPIIPPDSYSLRMKNYISPRILELVYTAWDIKSFADDVWKDADDSMKAILKSQWEDNKAVTGGHTWDPPEWAEIEKEGIPLPPFKWDPERRAVLRAELDAYYAKLYGLTYDELRYILDPKDVYGEDFPGETFRVLKEKEIKQYREYRTRRLVLEAWERV